MAACKFQSILNKYIYFKKKKEAAANIWKNLNKLIRPTLPTGSKVFS